MDAPRPLPDARAEVAERIRTILLEGVLAGEDPAALGETTPLITSGALDSVRVGQLVGELEDAFGVAFEAYEMSVDYLDTLERMSETVAAKLGRGERA